VTVRDTVRLTVPTLGDLAVVARRDPAGTAWRIIQAVAKADIVTIEEFSSIEGIPPPLANALVRTLTNGSVELLPGASAEPAGTDPQIVVFPLSGQKSTLAALGISRAPSGRYFSPADFTIA
jgi:hypothetical protein